MWTSDTLILTPSSRPRKRCSLSNWKELADKFKALAREENGRFTALIQASAIERLSARIIRSDLGTPWRVDFDDEPVQPQPFLEDFKLAATEAGTLLPDRPDEATPLEHWMDGLFRHCKENCIQFVSQEFSSGGGHLELLCDASATFCIRIYQRIK